MLNGSPSALMASARTATARRSTSRIDTPDARRSRVDSEMSSSSSTARPRCFEVVTVELSFQPDGSADAHAADQPSNSIAQNVGAIEGFFNQAWIAGPREDLTYGGPFRTFNAVRAIPFGIFRNHNAALVRRDRPRAADLAFVLKYIRIQEPLIRSSRRSTRTAS